MEKKINKKLNLENTLFALIKMKKKDFYKEMKSTNYLEVRELNNHFFLLSEYFFSITEFINKLLFSIFTTTAVYGILNNFFKRTFILTGKFFHLLQYELLNTEPDPNKIPIANRPIALRMKSDKIIEHNLLIEDFKLHIYDYAPYLFFVFLLLLIILFYFVFLYKNTYKFLLVRKYTT